MSTSKKWHQLVLIWVRDAATFAEYMRQVAPIVARYGGAADRIFTPATICGDGLTTPDIVNLVHIDSRDDFERFAADPEFLAVRPMRDASVDLLFFEGYMSSEEPSSEGVDDRVYSIEVAAWKDGSPAAYNLYVERGEAKMREYGLQVEYVMDVVRHPADRPANLTKVSYFPNAAAKAAFENDPMHAIIEEDLYPAAVDNMIWIDAAIAPSSPR